MDSIKDDIIKLLKDDSLIDLPLNIKNNIGNTSNVYIIKNYICKVFDISKIDTKKYLADNEFYFYNKFKINIENIINIPKFYGFIKNNNDETYGLILENMNVVNKFDIMYIFNIINDIIKLHLLYWNTDMTDIFNYKNNGQYIIDEKIKVEIKYYFNNIENIFTNEIFNIFKNILDEVESEPSNNKTLIHGSFKLDNILLIRDDDDVIKPYFIDWSLYRIGYGVEDILFLMIMSLNNKVLKMNYKYLLNYYFKEINKFKEYSLDDYNKDIEKSLKGFLLYAIIGLNIKNHFSKIKDEKINQYLLNYLYCLELL